MKIYVFKNVKILMIVFQFSKNIYLIRRMDR